MTMMNVSLTVAHPLDPLTADEISAVVAIIRSSRRVSVTSWFVYVTLEEPQKQEALNWSAGDPWDRQALAVLYDPVGGLAIEVLVSLSSREILDVSDRPGMQPARSREELAADAAAVKGDNRWRAGMARRGITDLGRVEVYSWPAGNAGTELDRSGRRLGRVVSAVVEEPEDNPFARPVEGLVVVVDQNTHEILEVIDEEIVPVPPHRGRYDLDACGPARSDVRDLQIVQPDGISFTVEGHEIRWQRWALRVSMHPVEGLVLNTVTYEDKGTKRPVCYRAGLSEMVVPYGDPSTTHWWKNAFDAGEDMIGVLANSLTLGCDCLGEIRYLDASNVTPGGEVKTTKNAICIHEEDYGILWKHTDARTGKSEVRRSRRLVVSWIATAGNYDYGFYWYFYQDGTIQLELKLTGILQLKALPPAVEDDPFAPTIAPGLGAPNHQHFFNFRLDLDVDGPANSVYEVEAEPVPTGADNPHGNAFRAKKTLLTSEKLAQRDTNFNHGRYWLVVNDTLRDSHGRPSGYKLVPGVTSTLLAQPECSITQRAAFATHTLWVTPYAVGERHAAGDYPNQHSGGDGLPRWTEQDRDITGTDVVLWYTVGSTHIPRPEDWPLMPVEYAGFTLKPVGFFDSNPALDVPPSAACHEQQDGTCGPLASGQPNGLTNG